MAKHIELLNSYSNSNAASVIQKIESAAAAQGGFYTVIYGQEGLRQQSKSDDFNAKLKEEVLKVFPDANIIAEVAPDGKRALIIHTAENAQATAARVEASTGQKFKQDEREIPFTERYELTKWRGHLGNIGQLFITASGLGWNKYVAQHVFKENINAKNKFDEDPDKVISSIASVMGNGLNSWFGVQKKPDDLRLEVIKSKVNDFILSKDAKIDDLPHSTDRLTHYTWREKPHDPGQKATVFFEQNAGIMSEVLKIFGKYSYFVGGSKRDNDGDKMHGAISMAAKFVTVLGKDEDPYGIEGKQDWFSRLRSRSNLVSGGMEWLANISQFVGALANKVPAFMTLANTKEWSDEKLAQHGLNKANTENEVIGEGKSAKKTEYFLGEDGKRVNGFAFTGKKGEKRDRVKAASQLLLVDWNNLYMKNWKKWDWLQLIGATFFTLSLTTKMMAPFTEKKVNLDELSAHSAVGLATASDEVRGQQTAEVASHLLEMRSPTGLKMLPEAHKQGLAKTFADLADTLYLRHEQDVTKPAEAKVKAPVAAVTAENAPEAKAPMTHAADLRDKIKEARERGEGAFATKFGQHEGMTQAAAI